jgi:hypothetical protein
MCGMVGNTLVSEGNGMEVRVQLHADGTYDKEVRQGGNSVVSTSKGIWRDVNGALCTVQTYPRPQVGEIFHVCARHMAGKKAGDTWYAMWPSGAMFKGRVLAVQ